MEAPLFPIDTQHGISGLLVSVCILLTAQLLWKVGEFLWKMKEKKDQLSEESVHHLTKAVESNTKAIEELGDKVAKIPKYEVDLKRLFSAVKLVAGERWPKIRKEIMDEHEF